MDDDGARAARRVADAADAWLKDPRDSETYRRLVAATLDWRDYTQPVLEGTAGVGRRTVPPMDPQLPLGLSASAVSPTEIGSASLSAPPPTTVPSGPDGALDDDGHRYDDAIGTEGPQRLRRLLEGFRVPEPEAEPTE